MFDNLTETLDFAALFSYRIERKEQNQRKATLQARSAKKASRKVSTHQPQVLRAS